MIAIVQFVSGVTVWRLAKSLESGINSSRDFFHWTISIHDLEAALLAIVLHHRRRLCFEGLHALCEDSFRVVRTLNKWRAINITDAGNLRRIRVDVVDTPRRRNSTASDAMK